MPTYESIANEVVETDRSFSEVKRKVFKPNKMGGPQKAYILKTENKFVNQN